jgi:hypothetical protein
MEAVYNAQNQNKKEIKPVYRERTAREKALEFAKNVPKPKQQQNINLGPRSQQPGSRASNDHNNHQGGGLV